VRKGVTYIVGRRFVSFQHRKRNGSLVRIVVPISNVESLALVCGVLDVDFEVVMRFCKRKLFLLSIVWQCGAIATLFVKRFWANPYHFTKVYIISPSIVISTLMSQFSLL